MAVKKVSYCHATVSARAGQGAAHLDALRRAGVSLVAFVGFPTTGGKAQLDFVASRLGEIRKVARREGWRLSQPKKAFLVHGQDGVGAGHRVLKKLADRKINVTAAAAVTAGNRRWGMILWVKPAVYARAARALGAR